MKYVQQPPFAVQIELVEGCSLACSFCGLQAIRNNGANWRKLKHGKNSGPFKYMRLSTVDEIAHDLSDLGWTSRIELAMHGNPSLHPRIVEIIRILRIALPNNQIMMTDNGSGLLKPTCQVEALFFEGLDILVLDNYVHANFVPKLLKILNQRQARKNLEALNVKICYYPEDPEGNPHRRLNKKQKLLTVVQDISLNRKGTHTITNQGGNSGYPKFGSKNSRCAKPFREMSIRWDGNVAICCDDWLGRYKIGNVLDSSLNAVWQSPKFMAARRRLYHKKRDFGPCNGCNVRSHRVGLLPDKKGGETMHEPTSKSDSLIDDALKGASYSEL